MRIPLSYDITVIKLTARTVCLFGTDNKAYSILSYNSPQSLSILPILVHLNSLNATI